MSTQFEFVFADGSGRPRAADRTLIRSRCMRGKNKREGSRRSMRENKRAAVALKQISGEFPMLPRPAAALGLIPFMREVGVQSRQSFFKIFSGRAISYAMSPLELCVDFGTTETDTLELVFHDDAYLHAVLFTSSAINDLALNKHELGSATRRHLRETLAALNDIIGEKDAHRRKSIAYIVMTLGLLSAVFGDWDAASTHVSGLQRIIQLCGGYEYLSTRPKLHYKCDRLDLAWSLSSGEDPRFVPSVYSWTPVFTFPSQIPNFCSDILPLDGSCDDRLLTVYHDLQYLTVNINHHADNGTRWDGTHFQRNLSSIQYRLLKLEKELNGVLEQGLCLAMLAFITTSFKFLGTRIPFTYLEDRLRTICMEFCEDPLEANRLQYEHWVLFVGAISLFQSGETWLLERWKLISVHMPLEWEETKFQLKSIMWIDCIHDDPGITVFNALMGFTGNVDNL